MIAPWPDIEQILSITLPEGFALTSHLAVLPRGETLDARHCQSALKEALTANSIRFSVRLRHHFSRFLWFAGWIAPYRTPVPGEPHPH